MTKKIVLRENQKRTIPIIWIGEESLMEYEIHLTGSGAEVSLLVLLLGKKTDSLILKTKVLHESAETKSRVIIKGALNDFSRVDINGLVKIEPGAKNSDTWVAAHLLLLSSQAGGIAVPNLEILENDVKAGHAATVGKVNEEELFYMMSRGLTKEVSTKLIVQGFLESLINEFPLKDALDARKKLKWS